LPASWRFIERRSGWGSRATQVGSISTTCRACVGLGALRAPQFGIHHYCTIGLNSKEATTQRSRNKLLEILPRYLVKEGVVAVARLLRRPDAGRGQVLPPPSSRLPRNSTLLVQVHTPHRDKKATSAASDAIEMAVKPETLW